MFKRHPTPLSDLLPQYLRSEGLETPILERRLLKMWDDVAGRVVARYTQEKAIRNQTLYVKISNPALRQDLSMMRKQLVSKLNTAVGAQIITDIRLY